MTNYESVSRPAEPRRNPLIWYGAGTIFLLVFLNQILMPEVFTGSMPGGFIVHFVAGLLLVALPLPIVWVALSGTTGHREERRTIWFLCLGVTFVCEVVHFWVVDQSVYYLFQSSGYRNNTEWQYAMHSRILALDPAHIPHCYRFLPDCIVGWYQWLCGSFEIGRTAYRLQINALFFTTVYRLARLHLPTLFAAGVVMLTALLFPIGILRYAGQFADPLSHLSFVACLYFLEIGFEAGFGTSLVLGLLAKESVIVMAVCRAFYGPNRATSIRSAILHFALAVAILGNIRMWINDGSVAYASISKVSLGHFITNLRLWQFWLPLYLATIGFLLPGTIRAWKTQSLPFRTTTLVLAVALIVSSLFFSWLQEARNLVPLIVVMAIFNLKYAQTRLTPSSSP